jgi:hypothetical protein
VLRVDLVGLNTTFHRFTYQVTVLINQEAEDSVLDLDLSEMPA